jgi:hypothetical protein
LEGESVKTIIAIIAYTLSLFGIDIGSHVRIDRVQDNGADVLYSQVVSRPGSTRFQCLRSTSGQCYYTVYPQQCTTVPGTGAVECDTRPVERFALARGDSRQMAPIPALRMCVSAQAGRAGADCE